MQKLSTKILRRNRSRVRGTSKRPRLLVFRSLKYTYAHIIDDQTHKVLFGVNEKTMKGLKGTKTKRAKEVGKALAKKAVEKGISACVFDRRGYKYHGRVKAVADGAREGGLQL